MSSRPGTRALLCAALGCCVALGACRRRLPPAPAPDGGTPPPSSAPVQPVKLIYPRAPGSFVKLVQKAQRGLVHLRAERPVRGGPADWFAATSSTPTTPLGGAHAAELQRALGSAFLVDRRGLLLTNAHLLGEHRRVFARLADGRELPANLVGADAGLDIAILRIQGALGSKVEPLRLGRSSDLSPGEWLLALGNPFGLSPLATQGIVAATPRRDLPLTARGLWSYLQTDLRIHAGNSGGPVLNMLGEVIGVATAQRDETRGIGFVLPIDTIRRVLPMLESKGKIVRVWVGMYIGQVDAAQAKLAGLKAAAGALLTSVVPGGPAARAGLRRGDIVLSFDGKRIEAASDLPWLAAATGVGQTVTVEVWRAGKTARFSLKTEAMPE